MKLTYTILVYSLLISILLNFSFGKINYMIGSQTKLTYVFQVFHHKEKIRKSEQNEC